MIVKSNIDLIPGHKYNLFWRDEGSLCLDNLIYKSCYYSPEEDEIKLVFEDYSAFDAEHFRTKAKNYEN
jgi:hypothetical protein